MSSVLEKMSDFLADDQPAYIWGAGLLGRSIYASINRNGLSRKIVGFVDSNPSVQGKSFLNIPVLGPDVLKRDDKIIVAAAKNDAPILDFAARIGIAATHIFSLNRYPELGHWSVEVVGACNLRCPSCPRGNYTATAGKRVMKPDQFAEVVSHIDRIDPAASYIAIYNWGDTLLHPNLSDIIDVLNEKKFYIAASSNLSMPKPDLESVAKKLRCGELRISLSGFTQEIYGQSHRGGDIEVVKSNMRKLRQALDDHKNADIQVKVIYHIYKHNQHEVDLMRAYAESLDFVFDQIKAILFPVEHMIDYVSKGGSSSDDFNRMADNMLHPVAEVLQRGEPRIVCKFWKQNNVDVDGAVTLCCITFDRLKNTIVDNVLDVRGIGEIMSRKVVHPTCQVCMAHKIDQFVWGDLWVCE